MGAKKVGTQIRREQIAHAAMVIIAEDGVSDLNIATIADTVGIVPSAVYRHFKNKDEIIDAVLDQLRDRMLGNLQIALGKAQKPVEQLKTLVFLQLDMMKEIRTVPKILFSHDLVVGTPERRSKVYAIVKGMLAKVGEIIMNGQERGEIRRDVDPETLAMMFLGIIQPTVIIWYLSDGEFDVKKHAKKSWAAFSKYMAVGLE